MAKQSLPELDQANEQSFDRKRVKELLHDLAQRSIAVAGVADKLSESDAFETSVGTSALAISLLANEMLSLNEAVSRAIGLDAAARYEQGATP